METSELLKKVRKIEIKTKGISRHLFAGEYHSAFKGRGMSFSEVREYQYGDDVRNIDWNVTARTGDPHIKVFEEERELTVILLVDLSGSSYFGTGKFLRKEIITEICAVLSFSAINNNDKVGILFFSDRVEKFIPPKKGKKHILRIIRELIDIEPQGKGTDIGAALEYFNSVIKKRSIAFVISDFLSVGYETPLSVVAKKHDVIGVQIYDPIEEKLPDSKSNVIKKVLLILGPVGFVLGSIALLVFLFGNASLGPALGLPLMVLAVFCFVGSAFGDTGLIRAKDVENNRQTWIDLASNKVVNEFNAYFKDNHHYFKNTFFKSGADIVAISTTESYVHALLSFFKRRAKR